MDNPSILVPFPVFQTEDSEGNSLPVPRQTNEVDEQEVSKNYLYEWMIEMQYLFPEMPAFEILRAYLKPVCPESIISTEYLPYFRLENAANTYGLEVLSLPMNLFEIFEIVRATGNQYENMENFRKDAELKQKHNSNIKR